MADVMDVDHPVATIRDVTPRGLALERYRVSLAFFHELAETYRELDQRVDVIGAIQYAAWLQRAIDAERDDPMPR